MSFTGGTMAKKKRSRGNKPVAAKSTWGELEHTFFASAPPDDPEPPAEPPSFDDLLPAAPADPVSRRVAIALASVAGLFGLSAAVIALV
jgi:hypothetical protein